MGELERLRPQRRNANKHTPRGMGELERSIATDGWIGAITVAADGETFDGSARLETLGTAGLDEPIVVDVDGRRPVVVRRTDIPTADDERAKRLAVAANRIAELNLEWDAGVLAALADEIDLSALFRDDELAALLADVAPEPGAGGDEFDTTPQDGPTRTQSGDLWIIGGVHRLLVGDCTEPANVERLMGGERAGAVVTDSPYGMDVEGIENDSEEGLDMLFDKVLRSLPIQDHAIVVNFQGARLFWKWLDAIRIYGQKIERALWFYKPNDGTYPWRGWLQTGQIIIVSSVGNPTWGKGEYKHDTYVLNYVGDELDKQHATPKPLEVVQHIMEWVSPASALVYDPFLGSGISLVAAHRTGRRCYGMEIAPRYADVILRRAEAEGLTVERADG